MYNGNPRVLDWSEYYYTIDSSFTVVPTQIADEKKLIIFNTHLSCGDNDKYRQQQADSFIAYLRDLMTPGGVGTDEVMLNIICKKMNILSK